MRCFYEPRREHGGLCDRGDLVKTTIKDLKEATRYII
jgi:hypothetical protein